MKHKHLAPIAAIVLSVSASAQTPANKTPRPTTQRFDWKLRLTKGQKWTQSIVTRSTQTTTSPGEKPGQASISKLESLQTFVERNDVLEVAPTYYLVRVTYERNDTTIQSSVNGSPPKVVPSSPSSLVGASFTLKQAPDGRVLDVMGLEAVLERGQKMRDALPKPTMPPNSAGTFGETKPSLALFKQSIIDSHRLFLPSVAVRVGEGYSYAIALQELPIAHQSAQVKSTLVALDDQKATFSEKSAWNVPTTQTLGARIKKIASSTKQAASAPELKAFYSLKGSFTGINSVSVVSGLTVRSDLTNKSEGKYTFLDGDGHRQVATFTATTEKTSSIQ